MISLKKLTLRRGTRVLLDGISTTIAPGERVGLVGRNGAGKSSLFALLGGMLHEDAGAFMLPAQWRIAQVAQNLPETGESATAFVLSGDTRLLAAQQALVRAEQTGEGMAIAQAHADLADAGAHDAVARAQTLILGLGFHHQQLEQPVNSFSGGWRMRLQLARALMCPSDLLLLDEPTNHLDLDALVWLESWLERYEGTLIVISHDREFLDAVTRVTLHIENARLTRYSGNYSQFEEQRAQQLALQQSSWQRQQHKIAHLQKFIDRFKAKATKARQAQSRVKALERMEKIAPVLADADFSFAFKEPEHLPNPMLVLSDATFGYTGERSNNAGDNGCENITILHSVSRTVLAGQRIGILGANGQGKSTLVKTIARTLAPLAGKVTEGKGLSIGYFAQQELDLLRESEHPLAHMTRLARALGMDAREQELRNFLGTFQFNGDMVVQNTGTMSGGEKARLVLAMMVWQRPNLLLLDEPTNHLDLVTREALSLALNEFEGTVMLVSHDRALLRAVCDEFWLVGRHQVTPFDGDLDDYQRYLLNEAKRLREEARPASNTTAIACARHSDSRDARQQRRENALVRQQLAQKMRPLQREVEHIDQCLNALAQEKAECENKLMHALPPADIAEYGRRLKACNEQCHALEERWLQVSEQIERLAATG